MQEKLISILRERSYQSSFLLHLLLFGIVYSVFTPFYQTNDDVIMMLMVRGISVVTEPTEYILFMNILIGKFLKNLFILYPDFDWYSFFMVGCLFTSFTIMGGIALKGNDKISVLFYLIAFLLLGLPIIAQLQFTVIASILAISGYFLLLTNQSVDERIIGLLIIVLASFIRYESYLMSTILALPLFLFAIYFDKKKLLIISYPILAGILAFALSQYSDYAHNQYDNSHTFNKYRGSLAHYTFDQRTDEETKKQLLEKVGWSDNDYQMFRHWFFMNDTIYNAEKFKYLLENSPQTKYFIDNLFRIKSYFFLYDIVKSPFCISALAITIIFALLSNGSRKAMLFYLFFWAYVFIIIVGIRYAMKAPPERILMPMFAFLGVLPILFYNTFAIIGRRDLFRHLLVGGAFFSLFFYTCHVNYESSKTAVEYNKTFKSFIWQNNMNNGENLYVVLGIGLPMDYVLPFEDLSYLKNLNMFSLGCFQRFKPQRKVLDKYKIEDIYLALIERQNVYLAIYAPFNEIELISSYMREHYAVKIKSAEIASLGQRKIIKLSKS
ncbi:hypothetical protein [Rhodoflexus sp.]